MLFRSTAVTVKQLDAVLAAPVLKLDFLKQPVTVASLGQSGGVTVCVDAKTGFLLRASTTGSSANTIEATAFADSTADDVKLPSTPQAMPGQ